MITEKCSVIYSCCIEPRFFIYFFPLPTSWENTLCFNINSVIMSQIFWKWALNYKFPVSLFLGEEAATQTG